MPIDRRTILKGFVSGALSAGLPAMGNSISEAPDIGKHFRIWDAHSHLEGLPGNTAEERMAVLVRHMDRLGIERLILSQGFGEHMPYPTPAQVREENDHVMRAVKHFPDRAYGSLYLNPRDTASSLQEFDRCLLNGPMVMVGELETDVRCNSPLLDPIVERAIAMNAPILQHTWIAAGGNGRDESSPADLVELARRHPKGKFICGHTGGTWELGIRTIRDTPNVYAGIAGSDPVSGFVEMAVRELGAERVIFGSDAGGRTFASQMAKVIGADIPDSAKELILAGNLRRLLAPVLRAKGLPS
ncbi:MAG TPA: amidohydrolase family protein [Alloacidobacterium sp.]|jgi:predicted TIM-barrel fold metal-dependent hydrolase|nr:amidohydrolase family protein [Alloacidobacterium sp.]